MNTKAASVCPNCFGSEQRKALATATSRNDSQDHSAQQRRKKIVAAARRDEKVIKTFCARCGHELHQRGNRV